MVILEFLVGKKIKVIFDDGNDIFTKEAIFVSFDDRFIYIENRNNTNDVIPINRIVRLEVQRGDYDG